MEREEVIVSLVYNPCDGGRAPNLDLIDLCRYTRKPKSTRTGTANGGSKQETLQAYRVGLFVSHSVGMRELDFQHIQVACVSRKRHICRRRSRPSTTPSHQHNTPGNERCLEAFERKPQEDGPHTAKAAVTSEPRPTEHSIRLLNTRDGPTLGRPFPYSVPP